MFHISPLFRASILIPRYLMRELAEKSFAICIQRTMYCAHTLLQTISTIHLYILVLGTKIRHRLSNVSTRRRLIRELAFLEVQQSPMKWSQTLQQLPPNKEFVATLLLSFQTMMLNKRLPVFRNHSKRQTCLLLPACRCLALGS